MPPKIDKDMKQIVLLIMSFFLFNVAFAQEPEEKKTEQKEDRTFFSRLTIGGYGEATYSRNFYSDSPFKYKSPASHADDPAHGRFDIPHAVINIGYDFGKGWTFGTEIEFEHGGSGGAIEKEDEEGGEWEAETEKGGEVELEQFWIQKSFADGAFNIRAGHIIVPVGLNNAHHEPLNYFTVHRSEGENTLLPSTWHQTGISLWGRVKDWRYEAQLTSGLDAFMFDRTNWIGKGNLSPYEFEVANKYGITARIDNYSVKGLRLGLSGYYGQTMGNTFPNDTKKYEDISGNLFFGALDFTYKGYNIIARGNIDYGYISDAETISSIKKNQTAGSSPYRKSAFGSHAIITNIEVGYDVFAHSAKMRKDNQKLYIFGHYEYFDSYINGLNGYTKKKILAFGLNYYPIPQIAVKAEYKNRIFDSPYNNEPAINLAIVYQGFFK